MPFALAENSSSSVWLSMSFITSRRLARRSGGKLAGRLNSGSRKSGALGSCVINNGSLALPRKLACWPGVIEPSLITCG